MYIINYTPLIVCGYELGLVLALVFTEETKTLTCPKDRTILLQDGESTVPIQMREGTISFGQGQHIINNTLPDGRLCSWKLNVLGSGRRLIYFLF